jgi:hypothetical protein
MLRTAMVTTTSSKMTAAAMTIHGDGKMPRRVGDPELSMNDFL